MIRCVFLPIVSIALAMTLGCGARSPLEEAIATDIENLETLDYDDYRATIAKLTEYGDPAVDMLIKGLRTRDAGVRCGCAEALGKIGNTRAVEPLIKKLGDRGEYQVREGLSVVFAQTVATSSAEALGDIGDYRAVEPLIELLTDRDPSHREAAMWALGKIGDARAIRPLIERTNDRYQGLAEIAGDVLNELTGVHYYDDYERWLQWYREENRP